MKVSRRGSLALAFAAWIAGCGGVLKHDPTSASALGSQGLAVAPNDSFAAQLAAATGRLTGDHDDVKIALQPGGGVGVRRLTVTLTRSTCHAQRRCLLLAGELKGKIAQQPGIPDRGRTFSIAANGDVKPLGGVSAIGTVTGVGNARFGRESLRLTLKSSTGTVVLTGQTAELPAFSSP
jgi:hypothetical protein